MHLKIGHGHEGRHRKESYVVFIPKKYSHFALTRGKKFKMNKMAQNGRFQFFKKVLLSSPFDFIFASGPKLFQINF